MVATDPLWAPSPVAYGQLELRTMDLPMAMATGTALGSRAGLRPGGNDFTISLAGTTVNVTAGVGSAHRSGQGLYRFQLAATSPGTLTAAHATFTRIDLVYIRVWDNSVDSAGLYKADTVLLTGTPSGSPVTPQPGATEIYIALGTITVPSTGGGGTGAATISTTVRQFTVAPGGMLPVTNSSDVALAGTYTGQARYNTARACPEYWSGSAWVAQGDWTAYTPTWGGALAVMGAAVSTGRWTRIGKTVHMYAKIVWGTSSAIGGGNLTVTAPTASTTANSNATVWTGSGYFGDPSGAWKLCMPLLNGNSTNVIVFVVKASDNGLWGPEAAGLVWNAANAHYAISLCYEAA